MYYHYDFVLTDEEAYYHYELLSSSVITRLYLSPGGNTQRFTWIDDKKLCMLYLNIPTDNCNAYNLCGPHGTWTITDSPVCACLKGFVPKSPQEWGVTDWSNGCTRRNALECETHIFVRYVGVKLPNTRYSWFNRRMNLQDCRNTCRKNCSCTAYSTLDIRDGGNGCLQWNGELFDIRNYPERCQEIYIRMSAAESAVIHPFAEHIAYYLLLSVPIIITILMRTASMGSLFGYVTFMDLMNNMGHCNFELAPKRAFSVFPPLKYLMYTPSYHSLHHTQFRTNYSLFMPFYDYAYGIVDKSTDQLYEKSLARRDESPDVVNLTHLTTPESIYLLPLGFAYLASRPHQSKWYLWLMWPITLWSMILTWIYGQRAFVLERHRCDELKLQTWAIPKYNIQCFMKSQKGSINVMMEAAILEAEEKGAKVLSLGLLNQAEEVNAHGGLYVERNPKMRLRVVDGSGLTVAAMLNAIPEGTTQVLLRGNLNKVAYALTVALSHKRIQVATLHQHEYKKLEKSLNDMPGTNLVLCGNSAAPKIWLVGTDEEQSRAPKGTLFIPFSLFPPKQSRKDCFYHCVPSLAVPPSLENLHSCENWLPRRVMRAWRVAGIVHAMEGWEEHECGYSMTNVDKAWEATLHHGFQPVIPTLA